MLENKIRELSKKIVLAATGIALNLSCAPSLTVPTQVPGPNGYVETGIDCCKKINCGNYDSCKSEGGVYNPQTGIYEKSCKCYDYSPPSKPSKPEPWMKGGGGRI